MIITLRSPWLIGYIFGWRSIPSYVTASHKLWWRWFNETNSRGWWQK